MQGGDNDVRGFSLAKLQDDFRQIGLEGADAVGFEEGIQLNLGRGHGLDLDGFGGILLAEEVEDDLASLGGVGGPVDVASCRGAAVFKLFEIGAKVFEGLGPDGRGRGTERLPVFLLGDQLGALGLDDVDGVGDVLAQLGVAQDVERGLGKGLGQGGVQFGVVLEGGAHTVASAGESSVEARISARWMVFMPAYWRCMAPPMCIRQLLSSAVQYSAPVEITS